ncbi:AI-2E family transporter [Mariprofundus sp. EBB-1]|uniref:AI-2E family transporter n=1 Tax=Mariprofundus sp. EBB-1 TaxID=2650971 RepID=UPI000EF269BE|nr:AI-2E family transporter [Mariprofundus sp. EBB-1]RLL51008.1 AI-2E family transporter [Mariprofundus sp. EBB-1]
MIERRHSDRRAGSSYHPVILATGVFLAGLLAVFCILFVANPVIFALCVSLALFAVLSPAVDYFLQRGWPTAKASGTVMGLATIGLILVAALLYPLLMTQVKQISEQVSHLDQQLLLVLTNTNTWLVSHEISSINAQELTDSILKQVGEQGSSTIDSMTTFFSHIATSLVLIPLVTFFLLCDFLTLRNQAMQLLPNRHFELGWLIYIRAATQLQSYIRGISIQAVIMATVTTIGFWIAGIDYAPLLGIIVGLLNMIPFFGISLAKIPPVVAVLISSDPSALNIILALAVVMIAQAVDNGFVIPRIVAKAASLHPLTVMLGVMLGGYYFGFFGLILTVPVMFSVKVIFSELVRGLSHQHLNIRMDALIQKKH